MANAREQMKMIETELERVRREIEKLRVEEALLVKMMAKMNGETPAPVRARSPSVKPLVLDIMRRAGHAGATTAEVDDLVREKVPSVAKDTVGSILSRLKGDGVLIYAGERYYEKQFAPRDENPFERNLRAVN
jgi:predicted nuclease with TOPRIM domain